MELSLATGRKGKKTSVSFITCVILILAIVIFRSLYPPVNILTWDVFGYYLYLPAQFIFHDIGFRNLEWVRQIAEQYQTTSTLYQLVTSPDGGFVIKYSAGMAVLNAPAFFIAHLLAQPLGFPADGFSLPYQYAWAINGLIVTLAGIFILRKILLEFFDETVATIVLVIVTLATNYFQLTAFDGYLTHNYTFTLCALITWLTIKWHKRPTYPAACWLGISLGLIILVRPSEMVCLLIPVLWGVYSRASVKEKLLLVREHPGQVLALILAVFIAGLPQLIYWKTVTGHFIFYSYVNAGEGFDFANPHTWQVLFSYRKGWLVYTPVMFMAIIGFVSLYRHNRKLLIAVMVYLIVNLYVVSSWTTWWYAGGSYSQRALLTSCVLMALPLGYFIRDMFLRKWSMAVVILMLSLTLLLNLFQTWQWVHGIIDKTRMTRSYYWAVFGKTTVPENASGLLLIDRSEEDYLKNPEKYRSRILKFYDFESSGPEKGNSCGENSFSGSCAVKLDSTIRFSPAVEATFRQLTAADHAWIRISAEVFPLTDPAENPASLVATFEHNGEAYKYQAEGIELEKPALKTGQWNLVRFDYLTPEIRSENDKLKVYFWLRGNKPILIDDLKVEVWEPK
ncbi:MAG TPA: hypothetical protein PKI35_11170 [Bacteroidales bacterium]|nr:hypothetical protein [Bacteroidales bacterium]